MWLGILRFASKRVLFAIPQIFLITIVTFTIVRLLPGDPADELAGVYATPKTIAAIHQQLGLGSPLYVQYWRYFVHLAHGDWGRSWFTGDSVWHDISARAPATIELITIAVLMIVVLGVTLGALSALARLGVVDRAVKGYGFLSGAFPDFWLGLVGAYVFFYVLGWAPSPSGQLALDVDAPKRITGMYAVDAALTGNGTAFGSALSHLVLPVGTLVLVYMAPVVKLTAATVEKMLKSEFCIFARACGLSELRILGYALRNSIPPTLVLVGIIYGYLLGAAVLVENVYSWGGLGSYVVSSVQHADYFPIQAFVLISCLVNLAVFLIVDILHFLVDRRIEI